MSDMRCCGCHKEPDYCEQCCDCERPDIAKLRAQNKKLVKALKTFVKEANIYKCFCGGICAYCQGKQALKSSEVQK